MRLAIAFLMLNAQRYEEARDEFNRVERLFSRLHGPNHWRTGELRALIYAIESYLAR